MERTRGASGRISSPRRLWSARWLCLAWLAGGYIVAGIQSPPKEQEGGREEEPGPQPPAAYQNEILRDFFRRLYPEIMRGEIPASREFVESFVDRQIGVFLEELDQDLEELVNGIEVIWKLHERFASSREGREGQEARAALRAALRRSAGDCDGIADRLSQIFLGLKRDNDLKVSADPDRLGEDLKVLEFQIREGDRLIRDYLFRSTNVVDLRDLKGENMLARLDAAESVARDLADVLR